MFFPPQEYPAQEMEAALRRLGVTCRRLPAPTNPQRYSSHNQAAAGRLVDRNTPARLAGFSMKIAALLLSSFQEVGYGHVAEL